MKPQQLLSERRTERAGDGSAGLCTRAAPALFRVQTKAWTPANSALLYIWMWYHYVRRIDELVRSHPAYKDSTAILDMQSFLALATWAHVLEQQQRAIYQPEMCQL